MILAIVWGLWVTGAALVLGVLAIVLWLLAAGFRDHQRNIGYGYGLRDGLKQGYRQGETAASLRQVLATSTLGEHNDQMLAMVGPLGGDVQDGDIQRLIDGIPAVAEVLGQDGPR